MEIVAVWALFGLMIGVISLLFLEERNDAWSAWSVVMAIGGAIAGGIIATLAFSVSLVGFTLPSIMLVIIGSVVSILIAHTIYKTNKR